MKKRIYELYHYKGEGGYYEYIVTEHKPPISKEIEEYDEYGYRYKVGTEVGELSIQDFINRFYPEIGDIIEKLTSDDSFNKVKKLIQERDYASAKIYEKTLEIEKYKEKEKQYLYDINTLDRKCKDFKEQLEILKSNKFYIQ